MKLELAAAIGAMKLIRGGATTGELGALGISDADWALTTSPQPWVAADRHRVRITLDALAYGTMDLAGVPRFPAPAEYIAAVLTVFVHPLNMMTACRWNERMESATELAHGAGLDAERVSAEHLFALCCFLCDDTNCGPARKAFATATGRAIAWTIEHQFDTDPDPQQGAKGNNRK